MSPSCWRVIETESSYHLHSYIGRVMSSITRARTIAVALLGAWFAIVTPGQAQAQAQNAVISGKVVSEFGQTVEGANVFIAEMAISVGTNAQGNYTITVPAA